MRLVVLGLGSTAAKSINPKFRTGPAVAYRRWGQALHGSCRSMPANMRLVDIDRRKAQRRQVAAGRQGVRGVRDRHRPQLHLLNPAVAPRAQRLLVAACQPGFY